MRNCAKKMQTTQVQLALQLLQQLASVTLGMGAWLAVAAAETAHHHHLHAGMAAKQLGQGAHEHGKAPVRFQAATGIGNHRGPGFQHQTAGQHDRLYRQLAQRLQIESLRQHPDVVAHVGWKGIPLELRRAEGQVAVGQGRQGDEILTSHRLQRSIGGDTAVRIEAVTEQERLAIELRVGPQSGPGPDISQVQRLAPAAVGNHHIGL